MTQFIVSGDFVGQTESGKGYTSLTFRVSDSTRKFFKDKKLVQFGSGYDTEFVGIILKAFGVEEPIDLGKSCKITVIIEKK